MKLEKRIEALEQESARLAEPHKVLLVFWCEGEGTMEEAIERARVKAGMTREEISKPNLNGLPQIVVIVGVKSPRTLEPPAATATETSNFVNIKSTPPVKELPLSIPNVGIV